jgi:hypothetical protein
VAQEVCDVDGVERPEEGDIDGGGGDRQSRERQRLREWRRLREF